MNHETIAIAVALLRTLSEGKRKLQARFRREVREEYAAREPELDAVIARVAKENGFILTEEQRARSLDEAKAQLATALQESTREAQRLVRRTFDPIFLCLLRVSRAHGAVRTTMLPRRAARTPRRVRRVGGSTTRAGPDEEDPDPWPRSADGAP